MVADFEGPIEATSIESDFTPRAVRSVAGVELDGESVLYNEDLETVHVLNASGTVVWNMLDGSRSVAAIADELSAVFSVDRPTMLQDVLTIVRKLGEQGLLDEVSADLELIATLRLQVAPEASE